MREALTICDLRKAYGEKEVLKGVNLCVRTGEILGILGVNGAGKTTLLECLEGFRCWESGTIHIHGKTGVVLQSASLPAYLKVKEALLLFAKWKGVEADAKIIDALGLREVQHQTYAQLSAGWKRRLHLAVALFAQPSILFLDEPTTELDVEGKRSLHALLRSLRDKGVTIVLSSHDMAEVESLCDRIAILHEGCIRFLGSGEELAAALKKRWQIQVWSTLGERTYTSEQIADTLSWLLKEYQEKQLPIFDMKVSRGNLEEHFMEFAGREPR